MKKRVLVVDDSVFARRIVSDILSSSPDLEVVGAAVNGLDGLRMVKELNPDVVTLDIEMPILNGLDTLARIMAEHPVPVIVLSSLTTKGARESIEALRRGAFDVMAKPHGSHSLGLSVQKDELIAKVKAAAAMNRTHLHPLETKHPVKKIEFNSPAPRLFPVVIIASSTGGPRALRTIIPHLTTAAGAAYVVIQHLPEGFSGPMANDLNKVTPLNVYEAYDGAMLKSGDMIFARAGNHCVFGDGGKVTLTLDPQLWGVRPAADVTMVSAAPVFGNRLVGVVLTGMGRDGAAGAMAIKNAGGVTIAEHESTCVVYGMPRVTIETGAADVIAPLNHIAEAVNAEVILTAEKLAPKAA